tara:strand:+ start:386 stop:556 length:171 start_codon:yes stop_codon:yes gene_type:complete
MRDNLLGSTAEVRIQFDQKLFYRSLFCRENTIGIVKVGYAQRDHNLLSQSSVPKWM